MKTQQERFRSLLFLPIALLAVFALVASACSSDDDSTEQVDVTDDTETTETDNDSDETEVDESTVELSDEEARAAVASSFGAVESGPMRMVGQIEMTGSASTAAAGESGSMSMTFEMDTDGENYTVKNTIHMIDEDTNEAMDMAVEQRLVDGVMYQNLAGMMGSMFGTNPATADSPQWIATDIGDGDFGDVRDDSGMLDVEDLDDIELFEDKGLVERDGETVRRIVAEGNPEDFEAELDDFDINDENMAAVAAHAIANYRGTLEFFIREDGSLHSYVIDMGLDIDTSSCKPLEELASFMPTMTGEFRFEPLPADFVVEAPDPADVMDMGSMFGGLGDFDDASGMEDFDFDFDFDDMDMDDSDLSSGVDAPSMDDDFHFTDEDFVGCPTS